MGEPTGSELAYLRRHQPWLFLAAVPQIALVFVYTSATDGGILDRACMLSVAAYWSAVGLARAVLGPRLTMAAWVAVAWGGLVAILAGVPALLWLWGMSPELALPWR